VFCDKLGVGDKAREWNMSCDMLRLGNNVRVWSMPPILEACWKLMLVVDGAVAPPFVV
jgi:hypothetical protein